MYENWYVYMIRCENWSLYTGITNNLSERLKKHNEGKGAKYTRGKGMMTIAWSIEVKNKSEALKTEYEIKKLRKKEKENMVMSLNPLLKIFNECDHKNIDKTRDEVTQVYSWAVPNEEALREICRLSPIVEMGAGTGYWSFLLKNMGASVKSYDKFLLSNNSKIWLLNPWHIESKQFTDIEYGTPEILKNHTDDSLFLCWPPRGKMAVECLKNWKGKNFIYVGEFSNRMADDEFHDYLQDNYSLQLTVKIPSWPGMNDMMTVWKNSKTD